MNDFESLRFDGLGDHPDRAHPTRGIVEFNEAAYLLSYPDVVELIASKDVPTGLIHYLATGRSERRLTHPDYLLALAGGVKERAAHGELGFNIEAAMCSPSGHLFVVGWADDRANTLLSISTIRGEEGWNSRVTPRCRRTDAEQALGTTTPYPFGFWMMENLGLIQRTSNANQTDAPLMFRARFADGRFSQVEMRPRIVTESELLETALGHFAALTYFGNRDLEAFRALDQGGGGTILSLNRQITSAITSAAHVERFGLTRSTFDASYIVCLFGKCEYFFLQNALFSCGTHVETVEFIYVSNSPELTETLQKEALIAERVYGLSITLITLTGNAGFSAANNAAARAARSERLVFINPDVFPRGDDWVTTHAHILETRPRSSTMLFGAPLYYDDGSLMHGGMYFVVDRGLSVKPTEIEAKPLLRVEHYGKGAPAWSEKYTTSRPVPAVTGAFVSIERNWFERLDGFTEDYVFGHYEDADLCLKSLQQGVAAWLQDVRFWHLEGKGSVRRPVHEGGSLVNRWHFTRKWGAFIEDQLTGRTPRHRLLSPEADADSPDVPLTPASAKEAGPGLQGLSSRRFRRIRSNSGPTS